ncbi:SAF domain-containing protein [Glycomyces sp. MUSA5-2]|uniref:SAF domain-containing protein n=1 Tax=Glycomyces sp. MUSA5-2 TaxID=2053002 RepID=UPI00300A5DCC
MNAKQPKGTAPKRRRPPRRTVALIACILAALGSAALFSTVAFTNAEERTEVLIARQAMPAGHMVTDADLDQREVAAADVAALGAMDADRGSAVVGKVVSVPVTEGALITEQVLGDASLPEAGKVTATVLLADGRWPTALEAGLPVTVMGVNAAGAPWQAGAVALDLAVPEGGGGALVSLSLAATDAAGLAGADPASLMVVITALTAPSGGN